MLGLEGLCRFASRASSCEMVSLVVEMATKRGTGSRPMQPVWGSLGVRDGYVLNLLLSILVDWTVNRYVFNLRFCVQSSEDVR